jgi:hypothetical protein
MMKMTYSKREQTSKTIVVLFAALSLLMVLAISTAYAVYSYGYKIGDKYDFNMQTTSTTDTPSGKAGSSTSYGVAFTIKDITEDYNSHRIDIKYLAVVSTGGITGLGGSDIISEGHMEGDPRPFIGGSTLGRRLSQLTGNCAQTNGKPMSKTTTETSRGTLSKAIHTQRGFLR